MKSSFNSIALLLLFFFFFFLFLTSSSHSSGSSVSSKHGITMDGNYIRKIVDGSSPEEVENGDGDELIINELIGSEVCSEGDEECLKRRIISEAHLDYIYTQHQKP